MLSSSPTEAISYFIALAALSDPEGHDQLAALLHTTEILPGIRHLSFVIHNPTLKIWLDREALACNTSPLPDQQRR